MTPKTVRKAMKIILRLTIFLGASIAPMLPSGAAILLLEGSPYKGLIVAPLTLGGMLAAVLCGIAAAPGFFEALEEAITFLKKCRW